MSGGIGVALVVLPVSAASDACARAIVSRTKLRTDSPALSIARRARGLDSSRVTARSIALLPDDTPERIADRGRSSRLLCASSHRAKLSSVRRKSTVVASASRASGDPLSKISEAASGSDTS
ncbi:MAG TPA: hypothetical protein VHE82_08725 [Gemmatimonadaceae bacterium]|nr:hypothetical protein [Gemmatimonadaceae bacterium]